MVVYCCVHGCSSSTYQKNKEKDKNLLQFFGIPSNLVMKNKWMEALFSAGHSEEQVAKIKKCSRICSLHFTTDCIKKIGLSCGRLKENSVPTIFPNALKTSIVKIEENTLAGLSCGRLKENSVPTIFPNALTTSIVKIEENTLANTSFVQTDIGQHKKEVSNETVLAKRICYAGDINIEKVRSMSPRTVAKSMAILKKTCDKKNTVIKRLRVQVHRQKRKIQSLETLLNELQTKDLLSNKLLS